MSEIKFFFGGDDTDYQHRSVALLARCFEEWRGSMKKNGSRFSSREISFIATDAEDNIIGHAGIMPFEAFDGNGNVIKMAGIASVGTDPDFRGRGIASQLCNNAADWAKENNYNCLPLYTAFHRVYESCGWRKYQVPSVTLTNCNQTEIKSKKGKELTEQEQEFIKECYKNSPDFAGKILRESGSPRYGWGRIFRQNFDWYFNESGYAAACEGVLAEFCAVEPEAVELCRPLKKAFLSKYFCGLDLLKADGWQVAEYGQSIECWHGESVMMRDITPTGEELFFPLLDKF